MNARRWAGPPTPRHGAPQAPPNPQAEWAGYAPPHAGPPYPGWPQQPPPGQRGQWPGYPRPPKKKRRGLKIGALVAGVAALLVIAGVSNGGAAPRAASAPGAAPEPATALPAPAGIPSVAPPTAPAPVLVGPTSSAGTNPTTATVARVVDGGTFKTTDGQTVRVLGIDSCEAGTSAGRSATGSASAVLSGSTVTLTSEPGVDRDRYNRALRYVTTSSGDFGRYMVVFDHTATYGGHNDAAQSYMAGLRALDPNGRTCDDAPPPQPAAPPTVTDHDNKRVPDVTVPDSSRSGSSSGSSSGGSVYENCSAARAAGAAPLHRGEPGYSAKLDRDGDGVACEPKPSGR